MHKVCPHHGCRLPRSPSERAGGRLLCAHPGTLRDTCTSVCSQLIQGQFSMLWLACTMNPLPTWKAATKFSVITHGQNCSSSSSSMTPLMSQGMQVVCFFPPPKSLSMMATGINHWPCPFWEQGVHEAALRLLPLGWKKLVQAGLPLPRRGKENHREKGRGESGTERVEPNHLASFYELETRYH